MKGTTLDRVAFSPGEFATLFGRSQTWGYRQIYAGKVKTVTELGRILIPAAEIERLLGRAGIYNGLKPKVQKGDQALSAWRRFIAERRRPKVKAMTARASLDKLRHSGNDARQVALQRLRKRYQA
jgi:hypothetical protein